jgi:hypothetical protein
MIKALRKLGTEGMYLNIIKAIYDKPTANTILNGENKFPQVKNEKRVPTFPTPIQHGPGFLARAIKQEEEIKGTQIGKEIIKLSQFVDYIIQYLIDKKTLPKHS